jgi:hypothetical protein
MYDATNKNLENQKIRNKKLPYLLYKGPVPTSLSLPRFLPQMEMASPPSTQDFAPKKCYIKTNNPGLF